MQISRHLRLLLLLQLLVQIEVNLELAEAGQVCLLQLELLSSKFLLSAPKVLIGHMHDGLSLRNRDLIITGHLVFGAGWLRIILVATADGETRLTQALHRLLGQLALQEVSQLHILIALEECSALSTRLHRVAVLVGLFISPLAGGADHCLVVVVAGAWEYACGIEPLAGLYM